MMGNQKSLERMSSADSFWLNMDEPTNLYIVRGILEFEGPVDYSKVQALLEKRLLIYNRFKQRVRRPALGIGSLYWEMDPHFDIHSHLVRVALPTPGDIIALRRIISDLSVVQFDRNKPLWKFYIIENYGKKGIIFFRIDHAIADGIALIRLLFSMTDTEPNKDEPKFDKKAKKAKKGKSGGELLSAIRPFIKFTNENFKMATSVLGKVKEQFQRTFAHPQHFFNMTKAIGDIVAESTIAAARTLMMPSDTKTSLKGKLGVQKSVAWSSEVSLDEVKEICRALGATVNDV
ncbi:hypothetical protein KA005_17860, partial [bacterium]|nr:hypothetical protein [bacterium]